MCLLISHRDWNDRITKLSSAEQLLIHFHIHIIIRLWLLGLPVDSCIDDKTKQKQQQQNEIQSEKGKKDEIRRGRGLV